MAVVRVGINFTRNKTPALIMSKPSPNAPTTVQPVSQTRLSVPPISAIARTTLPAAQFASVPVVQTAPSAPATESIIETAREKLQCTD